MQSFDTIIQKSFNEMSTIGKYNTEDEKMEKVLLAMTALEESLLGNASYHLNRTTTQI